MERKIVVKKMHQRDRNHEDDEYIDNPEMCLDIVEKLRREAESFIYGNTTSFQRTITVVRKKQS